jgi:hypothetical protein
MADLESIADPMERDATVGIIHNCKYLVSIRRSFSLMRDIVGQTPRKLFTSPHAARIMEGVKTLPLGTIYGIEESYDLLGHSFRPIHSESIAFYWHSVLF